MVSKILYFHPYLGKWSHFTNMFQMGWNHQLDNKTLWAAQLLTSRSVDPAPSQGPTEPVPLTWLARLSPGSALVPDFYGSFFEDHLLPAQKRCWCIPNPALWTISRFTINICKIPSTLMNWINHSISTTPDVANFVVPHQHFRKKKVTQLHVV